eukprot:5616906-Pyramimonas_sp.AAC.1
MHRFITVLPEPTSARADTTPKRPTHESSFGLPCVLWVYGRYSDGGTTTQLALRTSSVASRHACCLKVQPSFLRGS